MIQFAVEPLFYYDQNGKVVNLLAESYTVSSDGLKVDVQLRKNIKFQDGTDFNATAVKFSFDRALNPNVTVPLRSSIACLNSTEITGTYSVQFNLKYPFAPFIMATSMFPIISPTSYAKLGEAGIKSSLAGLGTGPFMFKEWVKGDHITFTRFNQYWGGPAAFDQVTWVIVPDATTREAMLLSGDLDMILSPPPTDILKLNSTAGVNVIMANSSRMLCVNIETQKGPLKDVRVRQALNYAIDKNSIVKYVLFNMGTVYNSAVPQTFFGYSPQQQYTYNVTKAKELLAAAGYPNGFTLKMLCPTGRYLFDTQVGEAIQSMLAQVGINVTISTPDWPTFVSELMGGNATSTTWDLTLIGYAMTVPDADQMLYPVFDSSQWAPGKFNTMFYKNATVDWALEQGRQSSNSTYRLQMYAIAQKDIWDDAPWIFLYSQKFVIVTSSRIHGLIISPYETFDIRKVTIS
jgi:peptide/nickel transport system substrate-binding protein